MAIRASRCSRGKSERAKVDWTIIGVLLLFISTVALLTGPIIAGLYGISRNYFGLRTVLPLFCLPLVKFGVPTPQEK